MQPLRLLIALILLLAAVHAKKRDPYKVLGVSTRATTTQIRSAYRKLSLQHHPDKNGGKEDMFISIAQAYEILSDEKLRRRYDAGGYDDEQPMGPSSHGHGHGHYHRHPYHHYQQEQDETPPESKGNLLLDLFFVGLAIGLLFILAANAKTLIKMLKRLKHSFVGLFEVHRALNAEDSQNKSGEEWAEAEVKKASRRRVREQKINLEPSEVAVRSAMAQPSSLETSDKTQLEAQAATQVLPPSIMNKGVWADEELRLLEKGLQKFPIGTVKRWEAVTNLVRTRTIDEVIAQAKSKTEAARARKEDDFQGVKRKAEVTSEPDQRDNAFTDVKVRPLTDDVRQVWSVEEDQRLVAALLKYPKDLGAERWASVAAEVKTRDKGACRKRFLDLKENHRQSKNIPIAINH